MIHLIHDIGLGAALGLVIAIRPGKEMDEMAKEARARKRCRAQGKIRFKTREECLRFCHRLSDLERFRAYECPHCHSWHFTSKWATHKEEI